MLSEVELYYSNISVNENVIKIIGEECHHIKDVMRHKTGDEIYISNGAGSIFKTQIKSINKNEITAAVVEEKKYPNPLNHITFCIPRLKTADRFEFALEKCVELGITNFIVFESERTIAKGEKLDRWNKLLLSAMKQSLRAWLPKISYVKNIKELINVESEKIIFDQTAEQSLKNFLMSQYSLLHTPCCFVFGPEGGLSNEECRMLKAELNLKLTDNRLRAETAIVSTASILALSSI